MKKICFLILMLVGISAKSNALQFSELCELFNNNASANMTINFDNGTSVPISAGSMMEICREQDSNNPWISDPVTNFSLAMIGVSAAIAVPCIQFIGGYVYNKWCRGRSAEEQKLDDVRTLLNGGVAIGTDAEIGSIVEVLQSIQNVLGNPVDNEGRNAIEGGNLVTHLGRMRQQVQVIGSPVDNEGRNIIEGGNLVTHLAGMSQQIQEMKDSHHQ